MKINFIFTPKKLLLCIILLFTLDNSGAQQGEIEVLQNEATTHYFLGIFGFNYTDQHIAAFSVDGRGGGNIAVSSPTSGGGGTVCCLLFSKTPKWPVQVLVRWQSGGCVVRSKNHELEYYQYYYKEKMVNVERGVTNHPSDVSVHFFKDGSVRVILVDDLEFPLLELPENRAVEWDFPECKPDEPMQYL